VAICDPSYPPSAQCVKSPASRKYIILAIGFTVSELPLSYLGHSDSFVDSCAATRQECDVNGNFPWGNKSNSQGDDFPSCLYNNESCSKEAIIARPLGANTCLSSLPSGYPITEDIIAILGAVPSSIVIYMSVHYDSFLSSVGQLYVGAVAIGITTALHFEALRLAIGSRKI
jgi:hypothetical protein